MSDNHDPLTEVVVALAFAIADKQETHTPIKKHIGQQTNAGYDLFPGTVVFVVDTGPHNGTINAERSNVYLFHTLHGAYAHLLLLETGPPTIDTRVDAKGMAAAPRTVTAVALKKKTSVKHAQLTRRAEASKKTLAFLDVVGEKSIGTSTRHLLFFRDKDTPILTEGDDYDVLHTLNLTVDRIRAARVFGGYYLEDYGMQRATTTGHKKPYSFVMRAVLYTHGLVDPRTSTEHDHISWLGTTLRKTKSATGNPYNAIQDETAAAREAAIGRSSPQFRLDVRSHACPYRDHTWVQQLWSRGYERAAATYAWLAAGMGGAPGRVFVDIVAVVEEEDMPASRPHWRYVAAIRNPHKKTASTPKQTLVELKPPATRTTEILLGFLAYQEAPRVRSTDDPNTYTLVFLGGELAVGHGERHAQDAVHAFHGAVAAALDALTTGSRILVVGGSPDLDAAVDLQTHTDNTRYQANDKLTEPDNDNPLPKLDLDLWAAYFGWERLRTRANFGEGLREIAVVGGHMLEGQQKKTFREPTTEEITPPLRPAPPQAALRVDPMIDLDEGELDDSRDLLQIAESDNEDVELADLTDQLPSSSESDDSEEITRERGKNAEDTLRDLHREALLDIIKSKT